MVETRCLLGLQLTITLTMIHLLLIFCSEWLIAVF